MGGKMNIQIPIETSARHVHISKEDFEALYGKGAELTFVKELSQPGQFLAKERITVIGPRGSFIHVAILGPFRKETQVELSVTDARKIGIPSVIRQSGDIDKTPGCVLVNGHNSLEIEKGVIVAKRHIHMTPSDAVKMNVTDNESVFVITQSFERSLIFADVVVRVSPQYRLAMHVDTDEANAFASENNPSGIILPLFDGKTYSLQKWTEELQSGINR